MCGATFVMPVLEIKKNLQKHKLLLAIVVIGFLVFWYALAQDTVSYEVETVHVFPGQVTTNQWQNVDRIRTQDLSEYSLYQDFDSRNSATLLGLKVEIDDNTDTVEPTNDLIEVDDNFDTVSTGGGGSSSPDDNADSSDEIEIENSANINNATTSETESSNLELSPATTSETTSTDFNTPSDTTSVSTEDHETVDDVDEEPMPEEETDSNHEITDTDDSNSVNNENTESNSGNQATETPSQNQTEESDAAPDSDVTNSTSDEVGAFLITPQIDDSFIVKRPVLQSYRFFTEIITTNITTSTPSVTGETESVTSTQPGDGMTGTTTAVVGDVVIDSVTDTSATSTDASLIAASTTDLVSTTTNQDNDEPKDVEIIVNDCLLYTSPSPRDS